MDDGDEDGMDSGDEDEDKDGESESEGRERDSASDAEACRKFNEETNNVNVNSHVRGSSRKHSRVKLTTPFSAMYLNPIPMLVDIMAKA